MASALVVLGAAAAWCCSMAFAQVSSDYVDAATAAERSPNTKAGIVAKKGDAVTTAKAMITTPSASSARIAPIKKKASLKTSTKTTPLATKPIARTSPSPYLQRLAVLAYIDDLVANRQFDREALMRIFDDARYSDTAARLMLPAASNGMRRDWQAYRARFVEPTRLAAGLQFWDDNAAWLERAERDFGIPPEIIVGILGCETIYGRSTGSLRVVDVLTTLSFDYPNPERDRSSFFREQLTDALTMDRDGTIDLASLRGSFAGAIGMPQFMPGSIQSYAVDYDGDGRIDLIHDPADVIGSVANFLAQHGWVRGLPTHVVLTASGDVDASRIAEMVDAGSVPSYDFAQLVDAGFVATPVAPATKFALIDLPSGIDARGNRQTAYLAGTQNFHVVTRYNRSYFYALSVIELGSTIKALRDARNTLPRSRPDMN